MNASRKTPFHVHLRFPPEAPRRLGASSKRVLRTGVSLAVAAILVALPAWFLTRFDPLGKADKAFEQHQYQSALAAGQNHMKWFPNDRLAALMVARCLMRLGRAPEAEAYYQKAAPLDLADAQVRAYNLVNLHEPKQAASAYDELLSRWPDDVLALKRLAAVRMAMKQWRDVLKIADRLIANSGEEVAGQTMAAIAHHELKHYDQAITSTLRVLELDHELKRMPLPRTLFWNNLALDLMAVGRTDKARRYLTGALAQSQDAGLMELVGLTYSQQGALDLAERCWRQAESWDPDNADVCLDLGRLAVNQQRWTEAVGFLKRAADRSTEAVEPLYSLSQAYRMLGNLTEAERYRRLADERRAARPETAHGMGADADSEPAGDVRAGRGSRRHDVRGLHRRNLGLALLLLALVATGAFMVVVSRRKPTPSLNGLEPLLAARRFDEAEALIKEYLEIYPQSDQANMLIAQVALERDEQKPQLALDHLVRIGARDRATQATVLLNKGKAYSALEWNDRAEAAWKQALELEPRVPEAGWALLSLYYVEGRRAEAHRLAMALRVTEPDPRDRAQLLLELVRHDAKPLAPDSLMVTLEPIVRKSPHDLHMAVALGLATVRNSQTDAGLTSLRNLSDRFPDNPDARESLSARPRRGWQIR